MEMKLESYDIGVIVARFQVDDLTASHVDLIESVTSRHDKTVIVLGVHPLPNSFNNPLDYECRYQMVQTLFPDVIILPLKDVRDDVEWSKNLDDLLGMVKGARQSLVLYGSRDSFLLHYHGRFSTIELESSGNESGTDRRAAISKRAINSPDFRAGVIWASRQRFPVAYHCVDIAILNPEKTHIALGKKPGEPLLRLPGGFVEPTDDGADEDARREALEETSLKVKNLNFIASLPVQDWRYRGEPDKIKTSLFIGIGEGDIEAADDLEFADWYPIDILSPDQSYKIMASHRPLTEKVFMYINSRKQA